VRGVVWILGIVAGVGLAIQVGMNSQLRKVLQSANLAATVSFAVGFVALLAWLMATRTPLPSRGELAGVPLWAWFGGLFGAFCVAISTVVATELGATTLLALVLLGQLAAALVIDHFGWLGLPVHPVTWVRVAGVVLLGVGVWMVAR
jgi:bacterial/archaeal transporter family-2 protein